MLENDEKTMRFHSQEGIGQTQLDQISDRLANGELMVYPTETVYGLGSAITNEETIQRVFRIKGRTEDKPLSVAVSIENIARYAHISDPARVLIREYLPGPLTMILRKKPIVPPIVTAGKNTVGIRVPSNPITLAILGWFDEAIISTSANLVGEPSPRTIDEVTVGILNQVDFAISSDHKTIGQPSTVVDATSINVKLLRQGAIPFHAIERVLKYPQRNL